MAVNVEERGRVIWLVEDIIKRPGEDTHRSGLISCPVGLAKWLDLTINNQLDLGSRTTKVKQHQRTKATLDGDETGESTVPEHNRTIPNKGVGGKRVGIITTKQIPSSNPARFFQSSFRVPSFFSIIDTSDILATLIPLAKRTGDTAKMENIFLWTTGGSYSIMSAEEARTLTPEQGGANVAETPEEAKQIKNKRSGGNP